ncbi:YiiX/YebB-like N1pC/P60 family cysteine hydrolase [Labrys sedimenti]|uniref:YiiX/YebB-like N1pC/P60 family cysteine hydrolase n=1 Tax=Labrys sedimenti TaxID=3106036 RepID=UPI002ACAA13D|nr:YiiX/YebB-like N1pC/P60 family cysteine hydrolase [Labrys sp. ZIDIC5]MDZ5451707.1 YiiX/YebB-like N1pC/P60 family cysteine hydrolase [Labrys sp. ZIDIC5]
MRATVLFPIALALTAVPAQAENLPPLRQGDLVFQQSKSPQSEAIRLASGSAYTHMGIVALTPSGPMVIEAADIVRQTPLEAFLARGMKGRFAVYRVRGLDQAKANAAITAARTYLGRPYDLYFRLDPNAIYCSELPYEAFRSVGITLGQIDRFGDLSVRTPAVKALFARRWASHPDCKGKAANATACWARIQDQGIVTPVSIARDDQVDRVGGNL